MSASGRGQYHSTTSLGVGSVSMVGSGLKLRVLALQILYAKPCALRSIFNCEGFCVGAIEHLVNSGNWNKMHTFA